MYVLQYKLLSTITEGLRKPAQEDLIEDNSESGSACETPIEEVKGTGIICWSRPT